MSDVRQIPPRILITTDFSDASRGAFFHALAITVARKARLTLLHTGPQRHRDIPWQRFPGVRDTLARWGILAPETSRNDVFEKLNINVTKVAMRDEDTCRSIVDYLRLYPTDLLVMASEGRRGLARLFKPSIARRVAERTRSHTLFMPKKTRGLVDDKTGRLRTRRVLWAPHPGQDPAPTLRYLDEWLPALANGQLEVIVLQGKRDEPVEMSLPEVTDQRWEIRPAKDTSIKSILKACSKTKPDLLVLSPPAHQRWGSRDENIETILQELHIPVLWLPCDGP